MVGGIVAAVVLLVATVFGLVRRRRDGVLRPVAGSAAGETAGGETVGGETAGDGVARARDGDTAPAGIALDGTELGAALGSRATLVQFSTAFCAPCRATKRILGEVTDMVDGVAHVEIDAETHLELVRRLGIVRTPTVLILDGAGRVVRKAVGQPRKADVIAALGHAIS
ncbi:TlpA family protein disulfide reductase [Actinomadura scrupuli]|uniref:TlpA family protein disulfide reductase n=1 Tax=Actinomadura scrupuli TaxID=559629 RepID=UPI003D99C950